MPARYVSYVLAQLEATALREYAWSKVQFANRAALVAILCTIITANIYFINEKLGLCSSAKAGIVLNLFLNFEQKLALCSYEIVLIKNCILITVTLSIRTSSLYYEIFLLTKIESLPRTVAYFFVNASSSAKSTVSNSVCCFCCSVCDFNLQ